MSDAFLSNISKVASILAMWLANDTGYVRRGPDLWLVYALVLTGLHNVGKIKDVDSKVTSLLPKRDYTLKGKKKNNNKKTSTLCVSPGASQYNYKAGFS